MHAKALCNVMLRQSHVQASKVSLAQKLKHFHWLHFLFSGSLIWSTAFLSYLPVKRIWRNRAVTMIFFESWKPFVIVLDFSRLSLGLFPKKQVGNSTFEVWFFIHPYESAHSVRPQRPMKTIKVHNFKIHWPYDNARKSQNSLHLSPSEFVYHFSDTFFWIITGHLPSWLPEIYYGQCMGFQLSTHQGGPIRMGKQIKIPYKFIQVR